LRLAFAFINNHFDVFDHYNVIYFLYAHGLAVKTEYRVRGIAAELLKARIPLMKAIGVNITASLFTTVGSQKPALKVGYTEDLSISYEIMQKYFKNFDFSIANSPDCKLLSLKI
jgi:GNAT superfamily N-acetyltransferase